MKSKINQADTEKLGVPYEKPLGRDSNPFGDTFPSDNSTSYAHFWPPAVRRSQFQLEPTASIGTQGTGPKRVRI
jgi:hypothetical protein